MENEVYDLQKEKYINIISDRKKIVLNIKYILYVIKMGRKTEIHILGGKIYDTRVTMEDIEKNLDDSFIKIHRGCIVSVLAIHNITDKINLSNGDTLIYTKRKKNEIISQFHSKQKSIIDSFNSDGLPTSKEEYRSHYSSFEHLPFAFTDIEMVFNEKKRAVDWIFRYGNKALAELEKVPLENLIGNTFGSLFANMNSKWLRGYERAALYGETIEMIDYSPEIDTYLKVICFPTFKGHCGCILFNISEIKLARNSGDAEKALMQYLNNSL